MWAGIQTILFTHALIHVSKALETKCLIFAPGVMKKVLSELDFHLPFCQYALFLANASEIYADADRFPGEDKAGFFNTLAFCGVFFGSPFVQSD